MSFFECFAEHVNFEIAYWSASLSLDRGLSNIADAAHETVVGDLNNLGRIFEII